jgi:hypothetical protein
MPEGEGRLQSQVLYHQRKIIAIAKIILQIVAVVDLQNGILGVFRVIPLHIGCNIKLDYTSY